MQLIVKKIEKNDVENIEKSFSEDFLQGINQPYYNQKVYKFHSYRAFFNIEDEKQLLKIDQTHYYAGQHVSTSYTGDWIFLAVASKKIGIDIEEIEERSPEMLDFFSEKDYAFLGEKSRENFFILWTAEECLIKTSNACFFEDGKNVKIKSLIKKEQEISGIQFCWEGIMQLHEKEYKVYSGITDNKVYSVGINAEDK